MNNLTKLFSTCLFYFYSIVANGIILRRSCLDFANFSYVRNNYTLQGSVIVNFNNTSPEQCKAKCIQEYDCKSINTENGGKRACQLNSDTAADMIAGLTLTKKIGWTFISTGYDDQWVGNVCREMKPCAQGYLCTDSCECPGYECHKCRGIRVGLKCLDIISIPLGLEKKAVADHTISASSHTKGYEAFRGRLNSIGSWCAAKNNQYQFIRVDFGTRKIISDIAVQGHVSGNFVKTYHFHYTLNSYSWISYKEDEVVKLFTGSTDGGSVAKQSLSFLVRAFSIRIHPVSWSNGICMRIEIYGIIDPWQPKKPKGCSNSARPLGMASRAIADGQIISSSKLDNYHKPYYARLNSDSRWCDAWDANFKNEFIQVDLKKQMIFNAVALQGHGTVAYFVKTFYLGHSLDGETFDWVTWLNGTRKMFIGNYNNYGIVKRQLNPPIKARFIRINPVTRQGKSVCLRMELYGCDPE